MLKNLVRLFIFEFVSPTVRMLIKFHIRILRRPQNFAKSPPYF